MPAHRAIEDDLVMVLSQHKDGIAADSLRAELEKLGHTSDAVRTALRQALSKGRVQLGRELRVALEAA